MSVVIEAMAGRHVAAVMALDAACYSTPWPPRTWRTELTAGDRRHRVALSGDKAQVVGHAGTLRLGDDLHLTTVAVHADHQGQGIASRLVVGLLHEGRADGAAAAMLEVRASARRTQRLYARLGFAPTGICGCYYSKPTDDAVIMWLPELQSAAAMTRLHLVEAEIGPWGGSGDR